MPVAAADWLKSWQRVKTPGRRVESRAKNPGPCLKFLTLRVPLLTLP